MSHFHSRAFRGFRFGSTASRRPRKRMRALRVVLGLVGVVLLVALLFVGVFVGAAMLAAGLLWRLWQRRGKPLARASREGDAIPGDYRVVPRASLPLPR